MKDIWESLKDTDKKIIIYGMGNGADKIISELERLNIPIHGIMASDDFVRGQTFHGFTVKKLSDFPKDIIILTAFGSQRNDVIQHILSLSQEYTLFAPDFIKTKLKKSLISLQMTFPEKSLKMKYNSN